MASIFLLARVAGSSKIAPSLKAWTVSHYKKDNYPQQSALSHDLHSQRVMQVSLEVRAGKQLGI